MWTIEQGPNGIDDRILLIVALHQDGVKRGDASAAKVSRAFDQACEFVEDGGGVALCGWRLARRKADFTLSHGETGEGIDDQKHVAALGGKGFGDRGCGERCAQPKKGRLVRGGDDDDGAPAALFAKDFEKFADLAATLAD